MQANKNPLSDAWLKSFHTARDAWQKVDPIGDRGPQQTLITDHFRMDRA
jgi:hypothetical protein